MNVNEIREAMSAVAADAAQVSYKSQAQFELLRGVSAIRFLQGQLLMLEAEAFLRGLQELDSRREQT